KSAAVGSQFRENWRLLRLVNPFTLTGTTTSWAGHPFVEPTTNWTRWITVRMPESVPLNVPELAWMVAVPGSCPVKTALFLSLAATRSPSTTPPVFVGRLHASAATLATKFPYGSRVIAYAVIELLIAT